MTPRPELEPEALLDLRMRLAVELGRVRMPLARAVALGEGELVELDRSFDEPVEIHVNGCHFGTGRLLVSDGEWALKIEHVDVDSQAAEAVEQASNGRSAGTAHAD